MGRQEEAMGVGNLQRTVQNKEAFNALSEYFDACFTFLRLIEKLKPTRIVSPTHHNYIFFQYGRAFGHKITRPLNSDLYCEPSAEFKMAFERFMDFLADLKRYGERLVEMKKYKQYIASHEINRVVYTIQQSIGCIGDSFLDSNQSRKRIGQLFETLVKLIIKELGVECEPRTIQIPLPGHPSYEMSYELDLVFSRGKAIVASETQLMHPKEVVGSVKTTSKDRIDKIFLDKFLLTKLLGRPIPVIAIFLHDVQRAKKANSNFGINSTFKSNHFLGYTLALNKLDGVYYIDPRPEMRTNERLREQIFDFSQFLVRDLWVLSG